MLASTESMSLLIVLNLVFAAVALAVGVVVGAWITGNRQRNGTASGSEADLEIERQKQIEREKAAMATDRLRDLATGVADDVGQHSSTMGEITDGLRALDTNDVEATGAGLVSALGKIVEANETLQERLDKAEEQIAAQAKEIHLHESEARTDSLTGLANRRAFDDEMKRRFSESQRKGTPLSLLILDIDFFKKFNDTHGHQAGDEVLRAVGRQIADTCREMDLPCRYGGEEFAVVMPATPVEDGKSAAERVRIAVESMTVEFEGQQLKVTTSVGLAQLSGKDDVAQIVRRADEALYSSKDAGRNCGHWHDGEESHPFTERVLKAQQNSRKPKVEQPPTPLLDGLPNRTKFADELRRRVAESTRTDQKIAVLVAELDNYQDLKQKFGNEVGHVALDALATVLDSSLRDMDLLARLSDNRFVAMLPGNTLETAAVVADRTQALLKECPLKFDGQSVELMLRIGTSQTQEGDSVEVMVGRAVEALAEPSASAKGESSIEALSV